MNRYRVVKSLLIGLAAVVGLVLVVSLGVRAVGAYRLRAASDRFEREIGSLSLLGFVRPRVEPEENAVTWLRPGVLATVTFPNDRALMGTLGSKSVSEWTPDELAALETLLERNRPAFEILGRARPLPASNWDVAYEKGNDAKLPDLLAAMNAGKLLAARGRLAVARGDRETALESAEILGALARSHEEERVLIMLLIGVSLERLHIGVVKEIVTSPSVTLADLARLEASLCRTDLDEAFRGTLRGEAAAFLHHARGDEFAEEVPRVIPRSLAVGATQLLVASALDARRTLDPALFGPVRVPLSDGKDYASLGWWEKLTAIYGPNIESAAARGTATRSARELARIAITLRREALASGSYPEAFVMPTDPLTGERFVFGPTAEGAALRSTVTPEVLDSIFRVGPSLNARLYSWTLPSASRSSTPSRSPAVRTGASS